LVIKRITYPLAVELLAHAAGNLLRWALLEPEEGGSPHQIRSAQVQPDNSTTRQPRQMASRKSVKVAKEDHMEARRKALINQQRNSIRPSTHAVLAAATKALGGTELTTAEIAEKIPPVAVDSIADAVYALDLQYPLGLSQSQGEFEAEGDNIQQRLKGLPGELCLDKATAERCPNIHINTYAIHMLYICYTYMHTCIHTYTTTHTHTKTFTYTHTYISAHIYIHTHTNPHTPPDIHMHIDMHTYTHPPPPLPICDKHLCTY
jgi:hypothetical protein